MSKNLNILDKLDKYFETQHPNKITLIKGIVALVVIYIIYTFTFETSIEFYNANALKNNQITEKLNQTNNYLNSVSSPTGDRNFKIKEQNKILNNLKEKLKRIQSTNIYFNNKLKELSFLLFNEQNWANFIDNISVLANNNRIKIIQIQNNFNNPEYNKVEQFLTIKIVLKGKFIDIMNYINKLEESKLVVDMRNIDININDNDSLNAILGISVWGMKY